MGPGFPVRPTSHEGLVRTVQLGLTDRAFPASMMLKRLGILAGSTRLLTYWPETASASSLSRLTFLVSFLHTHASRNCLQFFRPTIDSLPRIRQESRAMAPSPPTPLVATLFHAIRKCQATKEELPHVRCLLQGSDDNGSAYT